MPPVRRLSGLQPTNSEETARPSSARKPPSRSGTKPRPVRVPSPEPDVAAASTVPPKTGIAARKDAQLVEDVAQLYTLAAVGIAFARKDLAESVMSHGREAAEAWVELGDRNPQVKRALQDFTKASVWGGVLSVHILMVSPLLVGVMGGSTASATANDSPQPTQRPAPSSNPFQPRRATPPPTTSPIYAPDSVEAQLEGMRIADPAAYEMAMSMMAGSRDTGTGGPGDTVRSARSPQEAPVGAFEVKSKSAVQMPDLSKPSA